MQNKNDWRKKCRREEKGVINLYVMNPKYLESVKFVNPVD